MSGIKLNVRHTISKFICRIIFCPFLYCENTLINSLIYFEIDPIFLTQKLKQEDQKHNFRFFSFSKNTEKHTKHKVFVPFRNGQGVKISRTEKVDAFHCHFRVCFGFLFAAQLFKKYFALSYLVEGGSFNIGFGRAKKFLSFV